MVTQRFEFDGADGQRLAGRLDLPDAAPRAYALFAHCFACSKESLAAVRVSRALTRLGVGVLRFDFTGLGDSGGDFSDSTFSGNIRDLVAAAAQMGEAGFRVGLLVGHSLGGAAVLGAAGQLSEVKAVATIGAPFKVEHVAGLFAGGLAEIMQKGQAQVDLGGRPFTIKRDFVEDLRRQNEGDRIARLHRALLVMHSPVDDTVSIDNASAIFLAAKHPKSFISLDGADHLLSRAADADYVAEVVAAWASRYLEPVTPVAAPADDGRAVVEETGDGRFQVSVHVGGIGFFADEPVDVGGLGSGPTPYALVGAALGACTAMTLRLYAGLKNLPLTAVKVVVGHSKDKSRKPQDLFTREITLGGELSDEQRSRLMQIADNCPVHRTLTDGASVETSEAAHPRPLPPPAEPQEHMRDMCEACDPPA